MKGLVFFCFLAVFYLVSISCEDERSTEDSGNGGNDYGGDSDSDSDGDSDSDSDGDGDSDSDSDSDGDTKPKGDCQVGGQVCGCVSQTADNVLEPVDIIIAVDSSPSMNTAKNKIQNGLNGLNDSIEEEGIDARVVLIANSGNAVPMMLSWCVPKPLGSGQCGGAGKYGNDTNRDEYVHVNVSFGMNGSVPAILNNYNDYKSILREDASKQFVAVEDGQPAQTVQQFTARLEGFNPPIEEEDWTFNSVNAGSSLMGGNNFMKYVKDSGGYEGKLGQAATAFDELLEYMADNIVQGAALACEWDLPDEDFDTREVNVQYTSSSGDFEEFKHVSGEGSCGDKDAWYYDDDDDPAKVYVCPAICDRIKSDTDGKINIILGCPTLVY